MSPSPLLLPSQDPKLEERAFFAACLDNYNCRNVFGQLTQANFTQFDLTARVMVPGWPRSADAVVAQLQDPSTALQHFLISSACNEQCAFNQKRVGNTCVHVDIHEVPSSLFVTILFVIFIIIVVVGIAVYVARRCEEFLTDPTNLEIEAEKETQADGTLAGAHKTTPPIPN